MQLSRRRAPWVLLLSLVASGLRADTLLVSPSAIMLDYPEATQQVLVRGKAKATDLTHAATYQILDSKVAEVNSAGLVQPRGEGKTTLLIRHGGDEAKIAVEVSGLAAPAPVDFETQIMPLLSKNGCNMGGCHGKSGGRGGFALSVFGFDSLGDYASIVKDGRGRRLFPAAPEASLLLRKATGTISHGGGKRLTPGTLHYQRFARWITEGARYGQDTASITAIEVEPREQILAFGGTQQLRVTAIDADGKRRCVTLDAEYDSNAGSIARADEQGLVRANNIPGQAAILVRFLGHVTQCRVVIPRTDTAFKRPPENNFIDKHAWDNLQRLGIAPAGLADDATFLRRVYLDAIGTLPTVAEARAFLTDKSPDKRAKLIDQLLTRPEYADYWAMRWSDLLRVDRDEVTPAGAVAMSRWLRKQLADNTPYDQMVRALVTARGPITEGPASFYKVLDKPEEASRAFSQLFLGVRIQCAQCHHHPSDKWGQEDYFALAGFFTGVGKKASVGGGEMIYAKKATEMKHPRTGKFVPAAALGAEPADFTGIADRRIVLAKWLTSPENPFFARALVNRIWAHYFSRGLVEPLDDMRATNPATIEPLLDDLAKHFRDTKYDLKALTRTLLNSRLYQLAGKPADAKADDEQNFSYVLPKAMPAEVLLDAICQATGVPEKFNGFPDGYRAIQVWDNRIPSYFFRIFGRPVRATTCECERSNEPSIAQALHLMNSEEIHAKITARDGVARRLTNSKKQPKEIVEELYLGTLSRFPTDQEVSAMLRFFAEAGEDRRGAVEDVLWALLNTRGFVYNH
jgi:hypothetical protein